MRYADVYRMRKLANSKERDKNYDDAMMRAAWKQGWDTSDPNVQPEIRSLPDQAYDSGLRMDAEYDKSYSPDRDWSADNIITDTGTAMTEAALDYGPLGLSKVLTQDIPYAVGMPVAHIIEQLTGSPDVKDKWWRWAHGVGGSKFLQTNPIARIQNGLTNMARTWLYRDMWRHPHNNTYHNAVKHTTGLGLNMLTGKYITKPLVETLPQSTHDTLTYSAIKGDGIGSQLARQYVPSTPLSQGLKAIDAANKTNKPVK